MSIKYDNNKSLVFKSLDEAKHRSTFYPANHVVPKRVAKIIKNGKSNKLGVKLRFAVDSWVFDTGSGPLVFAEASRQFEGAAYRIYNLSNAEIHFNPYGPSGMFTVGNCGITDDQWLFEINRRASEMMQYIKS